MFLYCIYILVDYDMSIDGPISLQRIEEQWNTFVK